MCIMGVLEGRDKEKEGRNLVKRNSGWRLSTSGEGNGHPDPGSPTKYKYAEFKVIQIVIGLHIIKLSKIKYSVLIFLWGNCLIKTLHWHTP